MAYDFPDAPTVGQAYQGFVWDGEKWQGQGFTMTGAVRYDIAQGLTSNQQSQARANIAVTKKNYIINGAMQVSQENGTAIGLTSGYWPVDQFQCAWSHSGVLASLKFDLTNGGAVTPGGSTSRLRVAISSGNVDTSVAAGDFAYVYQAIEGQRITDLLTGTTGAKTVTLQFGVRAPAGTYCVSFRNAVIDRTYIAEYIISAGEANLETLKSITITLDTTGTWAKDNTAGLYVGWCLMAGTTYQQTAGSWQGGSKLGSANQFNFVGQVQAFELFDVSLTEGSVAPPFQVPDYASELALCQRYYWGNTAAITFSGFAATTGAAFGTIKFPVPMRASPTMSFPGTPGNYAVSSLTVNTASNGAPNIPATVPTCSESSGVQFNLAGGLVAGQGVIMQAAVANYIKANARL